MNALWCCGCTASCPPLCFPPPCSSSLSSRIPSLSLHAASSCWLSTLSVGSPTRLQHCLKFQLALDHSGAGVAGLNAHVYLLPDCSCPSMVVGRMGAMLCSPEHNATPRQQAGSCFLRQVLLRCSGDHRAIALASVPLDELWALQAAAPAAALSQRPAAAIPAAAAAASARLTAGRRGARCASAPARRPVQVWV